MITSVSGEELYITGRIDRCDSGFLKIDSPNKKTHKNQEGEVLVYNHVIIAPGDVIKWAIKRVA